MAVVPKLDAAASRDAPVLSQGCREFLYAGLLLKNESQITTNG
jgi:hypothetical protein